MIDGASFLEGTVYELCARDHHDSRQSHHERVPQAEREPYAGRVHPVRHEFTGGIVDRGDMVPVITVFHAGRISGQHDPQGQRLVAGCQGSSEQARGQQVDDDDGRQCQRDPHA